jgi:hypothetical protein
MPTTASAASTTITRTWPRLLIPGMNECQSRNSTATTNPQLGVLESPTLSVAGDTLNLTHEECAKTSGESFVSSAYRWGLQGEQALHLTTTKPGCRDKVAQTILASEPWTRS